MVIGFIVHFPDEIWTLVLGHLHRKKDRGTIHALRLVNRQLHRLADPLVCHELVSHIHQKTPPEGEDSPGPLQRLAWSVARQPDLSRFVKEIRLPRYDFIGQDESGPSPSDDDGEHMADRYCSVLRQIDLPENLRNELLEHLSKETPLSHLCLLLMTCTSIEILSIGCGASIIGKTFHSLVSHATRFPSSLPSPLHALTSLTIGSFNETSLASILPFLSLPSLTHLTAAGLSDTISWWEHNLPAPPRRSPPRHQSQRGITFVLDGCMLSGPGLSLLLRFCRARSLTARWKPGLCSDHLSNADIGDALREAGGDLEFLHIDTCDVYANRHAPVSVPSIGPLTTLVKLRALVLPRQCLGAGDERNVADDAGANLPLGLHHLGVLGVGEERDETLELRTRTEVKAKGGFEELREVVLVPWWSYEIEEWFGSVSHRTVDYRAVDYELERLN
ncbi:MAG: hypothetical protein Q9165_007448 [Trypethelium subeluteriae]